MALYDSTKALQVEQDEKFSDLSTSPTTVRTGPQLSTYNPELTLDTNFYDIAKQPESYTDRLGKFYDPLVPQENFLAEQQSGGERLAYMMPRIATKVVSEALQLPGYLGGAIAWSTTGFDSNKIGLLVDNFWQKAVQNVEEDIKDKLPVYTADVVKNGNLWDNITSTSFWASEGADGIGFLLAFLAPGAALRLLGFGGKMARLIKPGTQAAAAFKAATTTEEIAAAGKLLNSSKLAGNINDITSTIINTLFESAAEGGETFRNVLDKTGDRDKASVAAVDVLQKNFGILSISNYIDQKWLFGQAGLVKDYSKIAAKGLGKSTLGRVLGESGEILESVAKRTTFDKIGKVGKTILEGTVKEGFWEEGMQYAASKRAETAETDDTSFIDEITDMGNIWWENLGNDLEMQKSVFLGALFGSAMASVQTAREMKAEDLKLNNFHKIIKENNLNLYPDITNAVKKDADGNMMVDEETGKYIYDQTKLKEMAGTNLIKYIKNKMLVKFAEDGNVEAFEKLKDERTFDYFLPFLQMTGGLEAALHHIDNLAATDIKWMQEEGIAVNPDDIKKNMKDAVIKYQKIYDRVESTHDLNINVKHTKADNDLFEEFSNRIKYSKLSHEGELNFHLDRISKLRNKVAQNTSISSSEDNLSDKLIADLKETFNATKDKLSPSEALDIKNAINDIDVHIQSARKNRKRLGELYDNSVLKSEFESYKTYKKEAEVKEDKTTSDTKKTAETAKGGDLLTDELRNLYNKAVEFEQLDNANNDVVMHSADVSASYRDKNGDLGTFTFQIHGVTSNGNLSIKILSNEHFDDEGKLVTDIVDHNDIQFLNGDRTITYKGLKYNIEDDLNITKNVAEVKEERKAATIMQTIQSFMSGYQAMLDKVNDDIKRGIEYKNGLMDTLNSLLQEEQKSLEKYGTELTRKGTSRVKLATIHRERGKNIQKLYLNSNSLIDEIKLVEENLISLNTRRNELEKEVATLNKRTQELKLSDNILDSLSTSISDLQEMYVNTELLVSTIQDDLDSSNTYLKNLHNSLRGFHTSAARLLGLEDQVSIIREDETLDITEKENMITQLIATSFVAIEQDAKVAAKTILQPIRGGEFVGSVEDYNVFYEELGVLSDNINTIQNKIATVGDTLPELQKLYNNNQKILDGLSRLISINQSILGRFNIQYKALAEKLRIIQPSSMSTKQSKYITPEAVFDKVLEENNKNLLNYEAELGEKHVYSLTASYENFLYSTGNQDQTIHNDDLARWYYFVNKLAYKTDKDKNRLYTVKTFTLKQIAELPKDNIIRQQAKFFDGTELKTYDQLVNKDNPTANSDVKIIVFNRSGGPLLVSKNGTIDAGDKSQILWNSLPDTTIQTVGGYDRFTLQHAIRKVLNDRKINYRQATDEQKADAEKFIGDKLAADLEKYKEFKNSLNDGSVELEIAWINPGKKITQNNEALDVLSGTSRKHPNELKGNIHIESRKSGADAFQTRVERSVRGSMHSFINGYWYVITNNRYELIKPKTLGETDSVDDILKLIQYYANNPSNEMLGKYIHNILWIGVNESSGKVSPYKFIFSKKRDSYGKIIPNSIGKLYFGTEEISIEDLATGNNLESLRKFLSKKYWNFLKSLLNSTNFIEFKVDGKGNLVEKSWNGTEGGYLGFLFSPNNKNTPKGNIFVKRQTKGGIESVKPDEAQYVNQSLQLTSTKQDTRAGEVNAPTTTNKEKDFSQGGTFGFATKTEPTKKKSTSEFGFKSTEKTSEAASIIQGAFTGQSITPPTVVTPSTGTTGYSDTFGESIPAKETASSTVKAGSSTDYETTWNTLSTEDRNDLIGLVGGDEVLAKQVAWETANKAASGNYGLKNTNKEANKINNYQRENIETIKAWFTEKFPNIPVEIVDRLIEGKYWGRLTGYGKVLLSSIAEVGTGYHEGFHVYSQLVLNKDEQSALYSEVRSRLNKDLSDSEAEEFLAEEFRGYMLAPNAYVFAKNEVIKKNLFKRILDLLLTWLGIQKDNKVDFKIEQNFATLKEGIFDIMPKTISEALNRVAVGSLTDKEVYLYVKDINYVFFDLLFDPSNPYILDNAIGNLDKQLEHLYTLVRLRYKNEAASLGEDSYQKKILDNFKKPEEGNDLMREHIKYLRLYKINVSNPYKAVDESLNDTEDFEDRPRYEYTDSLSINVSDLIQDEIRFLIAGLPLMSTGDKVSNDIREAGVRATVRYTRIMNVLKSELAGLGNDFKEYADKLQQLSAYYPEFGVLLSRLQADKNIVSKGVLTLRNQFVSAFGNNENTPLLMDSRKGGIKRLNDERDNNISKNIRNIWKNRAVDITGHEDSYIRRSSQNHFIIDTKKLQTAISESYLLPDKSFDRLNAYLDILERLGIVISPNRSKIFNYNIINSYISYLNDEIRGRKGKELQAVDLFNPDVVENQRETAALVEYSKKFYVNDRDLSYINQSGNREYSIVLNSYTTDVINAFNRLYFDADGIIQLPDIIKHLIPYRNFSGNLFTRHSSWIQHYFGGGKMRVVDLKGIKSSKGAKDGVEISKATFGDYKSITFNALLRGAFPQLRSADRKRELAFQLLDDEGKDITPEYNITKNSFKEMMVEYLKDELATSFALLLDSENFGGNLKNYSENAKDLRTFDFIYDYTTIPTLEEFSKILDPLDDRNTIEKVNTLVDRYLTKYSSNINSAFEAYIDKLTSITRESLNEDGVIDEVVTVKGQKPWIYFRGIDVDILPKFNITPESTTGSINEEQLNRLILFANYRQFIGAQEQIKLIMGDVAMWENPVDFHKRVNGATSPKIKMADSIELRQNLDILYTRMDNRRREDYVDKVIFKDVISSNPELTKLYSDYNNIKGTDAASLATLDEIRDFHLKNGAWYPAQEKTYQWEMQNLALRLLELGDNNPHLFKIDKSVFTDPTGIFFEHTKGIVPKSPMFYGKELDSNELGTITMIKPQGFGNITDVENINAISFWKTAISPIFPSSLDINGNMFKVLMSMMANKQGIIAFESAEKGTITHSQNMLTKSGDVPKRAYNSQQMKYADFGRQLDISDVEKTKVRRSTQRTKLEFSDLFDSGKLRFKVEEASLDYETLRKEYVGLLGDIESNKRNELIGKLGLAVDPDKEGYYKLGEGKKKEDFRSFIEESFGFRPLPKNVKDGIDAAIDSSQKVFDMTVSKFQLEQILVALVREDVIGLKTSGDMLVQEANILHDNTLKFYRRTKDELGNKIILPMEIMIPLPSNLIPLILKLGNSNYIKGLELLNKYISDYNKVSLGEKVSLEDMSAYSKALGDDFFKILDIPMNRIPGQKISSLDIGRIVKFLPHYHGPKVVLPAEIVVKTGSDFDVDKMTSYFNNFKLDEHKRVIYNNDLNTTGGKENRLNELAKQLLLSPERFNELIKPLSSKELKTKVESVISKISKTNIEVEADRPNWNKLSTWWYNMQKGHEFFSSKTGTAIAATHNVAHALSQAKPVKIKAYVPLFFKGQEFLNDNKTIDQVQEYNDGFVFDSDGYYVSDNLAQFLSAFVDVVKDPFVYNIADNSTFNIIAFLNRYGKNNSVGLDSIVNFMTQESILEYRKVKRKYSPRFWRDSMYDVSRYRTYAPKRLNFEAQYEQVINNLKDRFGSITEAYPKTYEETIASDLNKLLRIPQDQPVLRKKYEDSIRDKVLRYNYKFFSAKELSSKAIRNSLKDQVQILDNFLTYQILGSNLVNLNLLLRPDTRSSMGRHLSHIKANTAKNEAIIYGRGLFNTADIDAVFGSKDSPDLITEFQNTKESVSKMFDWTSIIHKDPIIASFFNNVVYPKFADPNKWTKKNDLDRILTESESHFLTFIIADSFSQLDLKQLQTVYDYLFVGEKSVPKRLNALKKYIKDNINNPDKNIRTLVKQLNSNAAIESLDPVLSRRIQPQRTLAEVDNISTFGRAYDANEVDNIEGDLYEMAMSTNPKLKQLVSELIFHSIFQSGFHNTVDSYIQVIPNRIFAGLAENAIKKFSELDATTKINKLNSFLEQFYRNNAHNPLIVKRASFRTKQGGGVNWWFPKQFEDGAMKRSGKRSKQYFSGEDYISFNYFTHDPRTLPKDKIPPLDVVLYKRREGTNIFDVATKLGDGNRMKEYYPMMSAEDVQATSILNGNRYVQRSIDISFDEKFDDAPPKVDYIGATSDNFIESDYEEELPFDIKAIEKGNKPIEKSMSSSYRTYTDEEFIPEGTTNFYTKILGSGQKTLNQVLAMIERNSPDSDRVLLALALRTRLGNKKVPLHIVKEYFEAEENIDPGTGLPETIGRFIYDNESNKFIKVYSLLTDSAFEEAVLHEALHNLSHLEITENDDFRKAIQKLSDYAYEQLLSRGYKNEINEAFDMFNDPHEFLSYAISNREFQQLLATIPSEISQIVDEKTTKKSILGAFLDELMRILKKVIEDDVFTRVFNQHRIDISSKMRTVLHDIVTITNESLLNNIDVLEEGSIVSKVNYEEPTSFIVKEINKVEQDKESNKDFNKLYPKYANLDAIEKEALIDAINKGQIQLSCGI